MKRKRFDLETQDSHLTFEEFIVIGFCMFCIVIVFPAVIMAVCGGGM